MLRLSAFLVCILNVAVFAQSPIQPKYAEAPNKLDADVADLRYDNLATDLADTPPGTEHDLFAGVLADRSSRFDESIRLLTPFASATDLSRSRMALVFGSLADDNVKLFHYAEASRLYNRLLGNYSDVLSPTLLKDDQDDNDTLKLLLQAPPQTIDLDSSIDLPTHKDPFGSFVIDLTTNNITVPWVLDTGANFSVVSESFAKQIGVTPSEGIAHTMGATGAENPLHAGVIDELHIGTATLHHVVVLILPDANLTFGKKKSHTMFAILGYPVFQSLGIIRFTHAGHFLAGPALFTAGNSSPIYMEKLNVLFSCKTHNVLRLFQFDSGANVTTFFFPYFHEFQSELAGQKLGQYRGSGAGGESSEQVNILGHAQFQVGGRDVDLPHIAVIRVPQNMLSDHYYGNLGRDLVSNFESITLDFTHARVYLGPQLQ